MVCGVLVLVLGVVYKWDVEDIWESFVFDIICLFEG